MGILKSLRFTPFQGVIHVKHLFYEFDSHPRPYVCIIYGTELAIIQSCIPYEAPG